MPATMKELGIDRLTAPERLALIDEIWSSLTSNSECFPLSDAQREELQRRIDDDNANPDDVVTWEQVRDEARARWRR